jgi:hypothetical protein
MTTAISCEQWRAAVLLMFFYCWSFFIFPGTFNFRAINILYKIYMHTYILTILLPISSLSLSVTHSFSYPCPLSHSPPSRTSSHGLRESKRSPRTINYDEAITCARSRKEGIRSRRSKGSQVGRRCWVE